MKHRLTATIAAAALAVSALAGSAPASAAPAATSVAPVGGVTVLAYPLQCNWYGLFCHKKKRYNAAGGYSYWDICSNYYCTEFHNFRAHPPLSQARAY
jgi:hypothetical protein